MGARRQPRWQVPHWLSPGLLLAALGVVVLRPSGAGPLICTVAVGRVPYAVAVDARSGHVFVTNSADNTVSMLDARTGALLRTIAVGEGPGHLAVDGRTGRAFVVNSDDTVSVLNTANGGVVGTVQLLFIHNVAVDEQRGRVVVTTSAYAPGQAFVLDARSGSLLGTVAVSARPRTNGPGAADPSLVAVDRSSGQTFVVNRPAVDRQGRPTRGSVSVLDSRSGRVVGQILQGSSPRAVAVDETTGHLFVVMGAPLDTTGSGSRLLDGAPPGVRSWLSRLSWFAPPSPLPPGGSVAVFDLSRL